MNKEDIFQKLTQLFASKIDYSGKFNSLFFIEKERGKTIINFLNKQHYELIHKHLINEVREVIGSDVKLGHLNLKTSDISLKYDVKLENITIVRPIEIKPIKIKPKEKVELPTIRNKTIKQIERFMFDEYEKIRKENLKILDEYKEKGKDVNESIRWSDNWGQISFIAKLNGFFEKIKDYDED